ncbi:MAG: hypothetical protein HUK21_02460 [Fibrobacteraceae bacterium]|nr:hypothetical protein [Fibrobacteraceae bacterium]
MLKKLRNYQKDLANRLAQNRPLTLEEKASLRDHIDFFQHERLAHELVVILFALLAVGGVLFFSVFPSVAVGGLCLLFLTLLVPYVRHYYGLENGVQELYEIYDELERLGYVRRKCPESARSAMTAIFCHPGVPLAR